MKHFVYTDVCDTFRVSYFHTEENNTTDATSALPGPLGQGLFDSGAKPRHILLQFLVEALTLSLLGGLLGVTTGWGAARYMATKFGWTMVIEPQVVAIAVGFSAAVGVIFGLYPAYKASRLDPIQALRFE